MSNELVQLVEQSGLEPNKADILKKKFNDFFDIAGEWEARAKAIVVTAESQTAVMKMAREGRLFLRSKRIEVENTRKELKEQIVREGKAIDGIANVLKALIVPIEEHLDAQEHFVENKRKAEEEQRRLEAEKLLREKEERERLEREAEQVRIREENERLRKEAEAREKAMAEERAKAEAEARKEREAHERKLAAERKKAEEQARKEREAAEAKAAAERAEHEKALAEERKRAAAEAEKARKEAEAKAKREREQYEAQLAEQRRLASMVTCPECGHQFSTEEQA